MINPCTVLKTTIFCLDGEDVLKKIERVQSLLRHDSKGNLIPAADMSTQGRYQPHSVNDMVFRKVHLEDMTVNLEPEKYAYIIYDFFFFIGLRFLSFFSIGSTSQGNLATKKQLQLVRKSVIVLDSDKHAFEIPVCDVNYI